MAGLSAAQHYDYYAPTTPGKGDFAASFAWRTKPIDESITHEKERNVFSEADRLKPVHPVFVISHESVEAIRAWNETN